MSKKHYSASDCFIIENLIEIIMKKVLYIFLPILIVVGCEKEKEELIKEVPVEIIRTKADTTLYNKIEELFPERKAADVNYPTLFSDTIQKKIVLKAESEVYLTFIAEEASYKNTVGWYSYKLGEEPKTVNEINIHLLFPNVSGKGEGGELLQGDMLQLGTEKFPVGTVIGFFLIVKGWQNGTINYNGETIYTDFYLNTGGYQQHVLFKENNNKDIVLGFEDMGYEAADKDYNDILFKVSDNKDLYDNISFDEKGIPVL